MQADVTVVHGDHLVSSTMTGMTDKDLPSLAVGADRKVTLEVGDRSKFGAATFLPLDGGGQLTLLLTSDVAVIKDKFYAFVTWPTAAGVLALLLLAPLVLWGAARFARMFDEIAKAIRAIADGAADLTVPHRERRDEIGEMARALLVFQDNNAKIALNAREREAAARDQASRIGRLEAFQGDMEAVIASAGKGLFGARLALEGVPEDLAALAGAMNRLLEDFERTIAATVTGMEAIAEGDLATRIGIQSAGEFARLTEAANAMAGSSRRPSATSSR